MLTPFCPGLDTQAVFRQEAFFLGAAGLLSICLKLNLGNDGVHECTVLMLQYLVQILEVAKWGDA